VEKRQDYSRAASYILSDTNLIGGKLIDIDELDAEIARVVSSLSEEEWRHFYAILGVEESVDWQHEGF
jgi:hypothetical protein